MNTNTRKPTDTAFLPTYWKWVLTVESKDLGLIPVKERVELRRDIEILSYGCRSSYILPDGRSLKEVILNIKSRLIDIAMGSK